MHHFEVAGKTYPGKDEVQRQKALYRMKGLRFFGFSYQGALLHPAYKSEILDPFAERVTSLEQASLVLDIGAGIGEASDYLESKGVGKSIRLDISHVGLKGQKAAVVGTGWLLPFRDASFRGVHMKDVITHVPPDCRNKLFSEILRVLKPKGVAVVVGATENDQLVYQYPTSSREIVARAASEGFDILNIGAWVPKFSFNLKDWYLFPNKRFVISLEKKRLNSSGASSVHSAIIKQ